MTCLMSKICAKADGCDIHIGTNIEKCSAFREKETNFTRITSSPEALAKWVCEITDFCDRGCSHCPIQKECQYDADGAGNSENEQMLVEWLIQESE